MEDSNDTTTQLFPAAELVEQAEQVKQADPTAARRAARAAGVRRLNKNTHDGSNP
ncbi:hypothetical protein [Streptacidiphilus sp. MAP5-3]|uniref:hypothetical protein n=1 Tax=unclassified Streptacidiphilus TaxID=2643834 RepID=UPI0035112039